MCGWWVLTRWHVPVASRVDLFLPTAEGQIATMVVAINGFLAETILITFKLRS